MVTQLIARVDGLPVTLLDRERIWPPAAAPQSRPVPARSRRRIERQTAVVHQCSLPAWARNMVAEELAERERVEIRSELQRAGLL
jgi:hypothetical protein